MIPDPFAAERRAYHLAKLHAGEELKKTREELLGRIDAIPKPEKVVIPELNVQEIAEEVMSLLPKPKKLKNKKKAQKGIPVVTPEDVMAMIMGSLENVSEQMKEGDTIVINEAPQRVLETVREIVRENGSDVDYDEIYKQLDRRFIEWRSTIPMAGGGSNALSMMTDVRLDGVPQDDQGNYLLGQIGGGSSFEENFETLSKNLEIYDFRAYKTGGLITSVVYDLTGGQSITKFIVRDLGRVVSTYFTGDLPAGMTKIAKNIQYVSDDETYVYYSDTPLNPSNFVFESGDNFVYESGDNFVYN